MYASQTGSAMLNVLISHNYSISMLVHAMLLGPRILSAVGITRWSEYMQIPGKRLPGLTVLLSPFVELEFLML